MEDYDDIDPFADDYDYEDDSYESDDDDDDEEEGTGGSRKRKSRDEDEVSLGIHMVVSIQEGDWGRAVKDALFTAEDMQDIVISEMEMVLCGMAEEGNLDKAMERIRKLHEFKRTYQILDTPEHGVECIRRFIEHHPRFSINIDQCPRRKHYVHVCDFAQWFPKTVRLESDWKTFLSGIYYFVNALHPTISAFRNGALIIMEGDGMGWNNFCIDFERRLWYEQLNSQPFRIHEFSWVNTSSIGNLFHSLLKPILPAAIREVVQLGVKFDESFDGRLDELFLQPSVEAANQRQITSVRSFLELRYHNQRHFRIPGAS